MKACSKFFSIFLSVCMVASMLVVPAFAADYTVEMEVGESTVKVDETVKVVISNKAMTVAGFGFALNFDKDILELVSVEGADPADPGLCTVPAADFPAA